MDTRTVTETHYKVAISLQIHSNQNTLRNLTAAARLESLCSSASTLSTCWHCGAHDA